jgi:hypothetical protein
MQHFNFNFRVWFDADDDDFVVYAESGGHGHEARSLFSFLRVILLRPDG